MYHGVSIGKPKHLKILWKEEQKWVNALVNSLVMTCAKVLHAWSFLVIQTHLHFQEASNLEVCHYTENQPLLLEQLPEKKGVSFLYLEK